MDKSFRHNGSYWRERAEMRSLLIDYDELVQEYDEELEPINEPLRLGFVIDITTFMSAFPPPPKLDLAQPGCTE